MKKIICALLSLVLLCSCSSGSNVKVENRNLSYKAHIFYFGKQLEIFCKINENSAEYEVLDGNIKGFGATVKNNQVTVKLDGMTKKVADENASVFSILYAVTSFFDTQGYKTESDNGNYCVDGQIDFGKFRYFFTQAGLPISVNFENEDFFANFYDVTLEKVE